jgi:hypothetical protein
MGHLLTTSYTVQEDENLTLFIPTARIVSNKINMPITFEFSPNQTQFFCCMTSYVTGPTGHKYFFHEKARYRHVVHLKAHHIQKYTPVKNNPYSN